MVSLTLVLNIMGILAAWCVVTTTASQTCPKYICNPHLPEGTCLIERKDFIIELNQCGANQVCDIYDMGKAAKCRLNYSHPLKYPGEYCRSNSECLSYTCSNNTCIGKKEGQVCENDVDCHAGLYCDYAQKTCVKAKWGGEECDEQNKCAAFFVCNKGKCILQASLENGQEADLPSACKSFFVKKGKCSVGPQLKREEGDPSTGPTLCYNGHCTYILDGKEITEPCICGYLESGEPLCPPGAGEISLEDYTEYIRRRSESGPDCHITKGPLCKNRQTNKLGRYFHNAYVVYENFTRWTSYYKNSDCVKDVLHHEYWYSVAHEKKIEYVDPPYVFLGVTSIIVVVADVLLVWLYFRKWSNDANIMEKEKRQ